MNGPIPVVGGMPEDDVATALHQYIYDYLCKRDFKQAAKAFKTESQLPERPLGVDYPGGFLYEWWVVFWEIFNMRSKQSYSAAAEGYMEVLKCKHQQQVLQLQLHQTIQQRKAAKQAEVMSVRQTGPLGSGLGGEALHKMDAGQTHTLGSGIALAAGDRSNSLQTTLSGGGAASRRMLAALSMNPGTTGSPSLSGQGGMLAGMGGMLGSRALPGIVPGHGSRDVALQRLQQQGPGSMIPGMGALGMRLGEGPMGDPGYHEGHSGINPGQPNLPLNPQAVVTMQQRQQQMQARFGPGGPDQLLLPGVLDRQQQMQRAMQMQRMHAQQQHLQQQQQFQLQQQQQQQQQTMQQPGVSGQQEQPECSQQNTANSSGRMGSPQETTTSKGGGRGGRGGSKAGVGGRKRKASTVQCKSEQVAGSPAQQPPSGSHGNQADDASWLGQAGAGPGPGGQDGHFNFLDGGQDFGALGRDSLGNGMLDMPGMEDLLHTDFNGFDSIGADALLSGGDAPLADSMLNGLQVP